MRVRFWGVRGSIPAPGPHTQREGRQTTRIEVRTDSGSLFDAGTGIFPLAQSPKEFAGRLNILSHPHPDPGITSAYLTLLHPFFHSWQHRADSWRL